MSETFWAVFFAVFTANLAVAIFATGAGALVNFYRARQIKKWAESGGLGSFTKNQMMDPPEREEMTCPECEKTFPGIPATWSDGKPIDSLRNRQLCADCTVTFIESQLKRKS